MLNMIFKFLFIIITILLFGCQSSLKTNSSKNKVSVFEKKNNDGLKGNARSELLKLALEQAEEYSNKWEENQRDCAGFVRFLYRETVTQKSKMWKDWNGNWTAFVTAEPLIYNNFHSIGYDEDQFQTGDILVYHFSDKKPEDSWHLMVLLQSPWDKNRWLVTYHNGQRNEKAGIKKIWLRDLIDSENKEWIADSRNKNFLGVYRWNGWDKNLTNE